MRLFFQSVFIILINKYLNKMKKQLFIFLILLSVSGIVYSQNASTYFPSNTGYKWFYKNTPLDSLNNPQTELSTYQVDSFYAVVNYQGLSSSSVLSKSGLTSINQNSPYTDTAHYNFQSTNAFYYLNVLSIIGSIPGIDSIAFVSFLRSFETWYNVYRFSQNVNTNYTIFSRDTTITIDTLTLPLRLSATGKRFNDVNVSTVNGTYLAKKFLISFSLSYLITIPPFPPVAIPIVVRPDTTYIASGLWVIKDVIPSVNVDLSAIGFPVSFSIPGSLKELTAGTIGINSVSNLISDEYSLNQNYPNPFNPNTIINYNIGKTGFVKLTVYNSIGKEMSVLVNGKQDKGNYEINFIADIYPAGLYFYKLETDAFTSTKKMLLLK